MEFYEVDRIKEIISNIEKGIIIEKEVRSLGENGLKYCLAEGKYDLFKKLVKPFTYSYGTEKYYKYLLDPISLGIVDFINSCPGSIMEQWGRMNKREKEMAEYENREFIPVSDIEAAKEAIVLYPQLKNELLDAIYSIKLEKIIESSDSTRKYFFSTSNNESERVEACLLSLPKHGKIICVSSQIGCTRKCKFCAAGLKSFIRNLTFIENILRNAFFNQFHFTTSYSIRF